MKFILPFAKLNKTDIPLAGGKGANLGELTAAGLPVPAGFVLSTEAYDTFVETHALQPKIVEIARSVSAQDPQSSTIASDQIKQLFLNAEVPDDIVEPLMAVFDELGGSAVAVRSSATAEDLPDASFAGQQETFLNIQGKEALLDAVKQCWASLWTGRAIAYRQRQGIDPSAVSLAVVVQKLVPADASGILFTANPVTGERDQMLINATWGMGEAIVGGLVTPDSAVVDTSNWQILSRETNTKTVMTVRTEKGTEEQPVPAEKRSEAVLDDPTAVSLAKIGAQIEAHYGMPMDIEWAIADGEIFILQARPITSLPAAPLKNVVWQPPTPNTIWMRRQIVEHMPEPLSPLFEDLYLHQGLDRSVNEFARSLDVATGVSFDIQNFMPHGFAGTINGYAYTTASYEMNADLIVKTLQIYPRIFNLVGMSEFDWDQVVLPKYQAIVSEWDSKLPSGLTDAKLYEGIRELSAADPAYWFGSAVNLGLSRVLDQVFDRLLKSFLFRSALPKAGLGSSAFLRGFDSKALDAQADLEKMAADIRGSELLHELTLRTPATQLARALADHPEGRPILEQIDRYFSEYGHQIYNLDYVNPTQSEDPLPMLLSLKALVERPPAEDVRMRQNKMRAEREALVEETSAALNPISQKLFQWLWKWTKYYAPYREHVMFYMGAGWPTVRKLATELGRRLTKAGVIAQPDDIYYLRSAEIESILEAAPKSVLLPDLKQLAQERRELRESRMQLTPLPKVPVGSSLKIGPIDISLFDPTPEEADGTGAVLKGYAVSTGRVMAEASVIQSIDDFDKMRPNTILVCTTTTPAWTPLFSQAVGLVTDVGGALAHGSIVAREYGIPAVMGTGIATERIKNGMLLAIDGDKGTVTLVDEVDEQEEARMAAEEAAEARATFLKRTAIVTGIIGLIIGLNWWRRRRKSS